MRLRPYQRECSDAVIDCIAAGETRLLIGMPTGGGKTIVFTDIAGRMLADPFADGPVVMIAHRRELLTQAKKHFENVLDLGPEWLESSEGLFGENRMVERVQIEQAEKRFDCNAKIICASLMSICRKGRLPENLRPRLVIYDEAHRSNSAQAVKVLKQLGCFDAENPVPLVGVTATVKRTDKKTIVAYNVDGSPVPIRGNKQKDRDNCVYQKMAYEYTMLDGMTDRWLVDIRAIRTAAGVDLSDIGSKGDDFDQAELAERVNNDPRTMGVITEWKRIASDRQTIGFCASVAHSKAAAALCQLAGIDARHIDGETPDDVRDALLAAFRNREFPILWNYNIAVEGFDFPEVSCILGLRPTESWLVAVQMIGRGLRPLPGTVDGWETAEERHAAMLASPKRDCLYIDASDILGKHNVCTVPATIGLPSGLDLQGHTLLEAKELLERFDEATTRARIELDPPTTFTELALRFEHVDLLAAVHERKQSQARSGRVAEQPWTVAMNTLGEAYRYVHTSPGREALLTHDAAGWHLRLTENGKEVARKDLPPRVEMVGAFNTLTPFVKHIWPPSVPKAEQTNCQRLSKGQYNVLRYVARMKDDEINAMQYGYCKILVGKVLEEKRKRKDGIAA